MHQLHSWSQTQSGKALKQHPVENPGAIESKLSFVRSRLVTDSFSNDSKPVSVKSLSLAARKLPLVSLNLVINSFSTDSETVSCFNLVQRSRADCMKIILCFLMFNFTLIWFWNTFWSKIGSWKLFYFRLGSLTKIFLTSWLIEAIYCTMPTQ